MTPAHSLAAHVPQIPHCDEFHDCLPTAIVSALETLLIQQPSPSSNSPHLELRPPDSPLYLLDHSFLI
jgi:hypothetical protein